MEPELASCGPSCLTFTISFIISPPLPWSSLTGTPLPNMASFQLPNTSFIHEWKQPTHRASSVPAQPSRFPPHNIFSETPPELAKKTHVQSSGLAEEQEARAAETSASRGMRPQRAEERTPRHAYHTKPGREHTTVRELLIKRKIKRTSRSITSQIGSWRWMGFREA